MDLWKENYSIKTLTFLELDRNGERNECQEVGAWFIERTFKGPGLSLS